MRIIRGNHKGKRIIAPNNISVRPTTDFAKESLFNVLGNYFHFDMVSVLDLFAGTGNISYEFAARDAINVIAIEINHACANFIAQTARSLSFDRLSVLKADAFSYLSGSTRQFNIIYADPPYDCDKYNTIIESVFERNMLLPDGFLVLEHDKRKNFQTHPKFYQQRVYGRVNFSIFTEL
ncbi:MAG: 16S rRNA (guanine(966)-N(2))-methyltransferase RsmD [Bacteroidales bacterium]|jgi:16S rRNA (guanine(966)-N(2))-methyltransferase RsmD|nr:16S rRNA (guanine(966)-N(2))-methyltransferase RsmD [Bacteroidales bacterium]